MSTQQLSLGTIVPLPDNKQPRCVTLYDDNQFTVGFVDGCIASYERPTDTQTNQFQIIPDSTHKVSTGIIFGINLVPEGHETLAETSILVGAGDKSLRNVLIDGTELFSVTPQTHPNTSHTAAVECIAIAEDSRQTLITSGWDGLVKFWQSDCCMLSLSLKNQYSTQFAVVNNNYIVVGSGSKSLQLVKINFDLLYSKYDDRVAEVESSKTMIDDEFVDETELKNLLKEPSMQDQFAIREDVILNCSLIEEAHDHAIRRIIPIYHSTDTFTNKIVKYVGSIGNDGMLKIWNIENEMLEKVAEVEVLRSQGDQSEFIYDIVQNVHYLTSPTPAVVVTIACDDRTIRTLDISFVLNENPDTQNSQNSQNSTILSPIQNTMLLTSDTVTSSYHSPYEIQCIELPAVPRSILSFKECTDLITVTAGGIYTFTYDTSKYANNDIITIYSQTIQANIEKAKKMANIELDGLPTAEVLLKVGEKDGAHKIVNISGKPMVVQWSSARFEWVLIGEAMGSNNEKGQGNKKEYKGKFYDHVVDVDTGTEVRLILAFNSDDDPYDVAQRFIHEHQMDQGVLMQIVQFIAPYIDTKKLQRRKEAEELAKQQQLSQYTLTSWGFLTRSTINTNTIANAMGKRVKDIITNNNNNNQTDLLWPNATGDSKTDVLLSHLLYTTQQAPTVAPESILNNNDQLLLTKMITTWPHDILTPVFDILRVLACETTANNVMFNPTMEKHDRSSSLSLFNKELYTLLKDKMKNTLHTSLMSSDNNNNNIFATISLILDTYANIIAKRTNHRTIDAQLDMFVYFDELYNNIVMVDGNNNNNNNNNNDQSLTTSSLIKFITTSTNGLKLLMPLYRIVHNITSYCNRIGSQVMGPEVPVSKQKALAENITTTNIKWVCFFTQCVEQVSTINIDTTTNCWNKDSPTWEFLVDYVHTVGYECDLLPQLKTTLANKYINFMANFIPNNLLFYIKNIAKTREEQANAQMLLRDMRLLFKGNDNNKK